MPLTGRLKVSNNSPRHSESWLSNSHSSLSSSSLSSSLPSAEALLSKRTRRLRLLENDAMRELKSYDAIRREKMDNAVIKLKSLANSRFGSMRNMLAAVTLSHCIILYGLNFILLIILCIVWEAGGRRLDA